MIKTINLHHQVPTMDGSLRILQGINLTIERGETVAIVGASGSGKSTLLGMLAGLDVPSEGKIVLDNREITTLDDLIDHPLNL